jgi:hypothetical protein
MSKAIEIVKASAAVEDVREWNDRVYVNLIGADRRANGDRSAKIWIKSDVLTIEGGKGSDSPGFLRAIETLRGELEAAGAIRKSYADYAVEATYTF